MRDINDDYYCSANFKRNSPNFIGEVKCYGADNKVCSNRCSAYHRKYPTPEQFKEEYGEDVFDDMPVWSLCFSYPESWELVEYWRHKQKVQDLKRLDKDFDTDSSDYVCVVACSPFSKPNNDWRPQEIKL